MRAKRICLIATMDTKAKEARFLRSELERLGLLVTLVDTGILKESPEDVDIWEGVCAGWWTGCTGVESLRRPFRWAARAARRWRAWLCERFRWACPR